MPRRLTIRKLIEVNYDQCQVDGGRGMIDTSLGASFCLGHGTRSGLEDATRRTQGDPSHRGGVGGGSKNRGHKGDEPDGEDIIVFWTGFMWSWFCSSATTRHPASASCYFCLEHENGFSLA